MKRIITYLIVLLVSLPAIGQIIDEGPQKFKKHNLFDAFKKHITDNKNNYYQVISKFNEINRLAKAADKKELDSVVSESWDDNLNDWVKDSKEEFTYGASENVKNFATYNWDDNNSEWIPTAKFEFAFDSNRNLIELINYWWAPWTNEWLFSVSYEYAYDVNNNLIRQTQFNSINNPSYKSEYTYDSNQNMILEIYSEWNPGENKWMYTYKDELTYDSSNNLIQELYFWWNFGSNDWDLANSKWDYVYDSSNNLILEILTTWDGNYWVNQNKFEYTHDSEGHITSETESLWNVVSDDWVYYYKDEYAYDANYNRTIGNYYEYTLNTWSIYYKDEFTYDFAYGMNDIVAPILLLDFIGMGYDETVLAFNNMVIGYSGSEFVSPNWIDTDKSTFYYSNYNPLNINDAIVSKNIKLYPNPVHDVLTINSEIPLNRVEIYSLLGKKVTEVKTHFDAIPVNNLSKGVYILKIVSDKGYATRKLIKK